jgi:hypothetical protein
MRSLAVVTLALMCAAPVQAKFEIRDVQASLGPLGPERKSAEYVAGDEVFFRFTVAGVRTDDDGWARAEIRMTVTDAKGKVITRDESPFQQMIDLGGGSVPASASFNVGEDVPPGEYELAVVFTDLLARESVSFKRKVVCKAEEFALVRVRFSHDAAGMVPAPVGGTVRQKLFVRLKAVGFARKDEIDVEMEMTVLDEKGKPVIPKPIRAAAHTEKPDEVKHATSVTLPGTVGLNRPGEFVLRIVVTDKLTNKKLTFETPLRVTAP